MALVIKINSVDRSSSVKWPTLALTSVLSKEVDRLEFRIVKTPAKTIPTVGQEITLEENGTKIFGGVIVEINEVVEGGVLLGYHVRCKDYSHFLDRRLVTKSYSSQSAHAIFLDVISTFTSGFTTTAVSLLGPTVESMKFNYEQVTRCLTKLADHIGWDWYVDPDKDLHFFSTELNDAPFELTDTNGSYIWNTLELNQTILQVKNVVFVRGGEYKRTIEEADAIDDYRAGTGQKTFPLAYKYDDITVELNGLVQTIGTDQQTDPDTVDLLYNFNEKFITFSSALSSGDRVVVYGDAFIPIIASARHQASVTAYGTYEVAVVDKNIESVSEAQNRAKAELKKYSETVYEGWFRTREMGLRVGQRIHITSTLRSIDKYFKINRIIGKAISATEMEYQIYLIASGQVTLTDVFIELLERDKQNIVVATNEVLQRLERLMDEFEMTDSDASFSDNSPPYHWAPGGANPLTWNLGTWT